MRLFKKISTLLYINEIQNWRIKIIRRLRVLPYVITIIMIHKKIMKNRKIRLVYLYEFKLGHKATEACTNINSAFDKGTVNVRTVQRWLRKLTIKTKK
jgi:hypothetical protein